MPDSPAVVANNIVPEWANYPKQDSAAVKAWRDKFSLNTSKYWKWAIDTTVTDLKLWEFCLNSWGYWKNGKWKSFNPFALDHLLSEYERLERKGINGENLSYQEQFQVELSDEDRRAILRARRQQFRRKK
jgi:hypothetical protein